MLMLIFAATHALGGYPMTLAKMRHMFDVMVAVDDRDHDHRISRAEWDRLSDIEFSHTRPSLTAQNRRDLERDSVAEFTREDGNRDGFLTVDEMIQSRMSGFRCMDENHDGSVTKAEVAETMSHCGDVDDHTENPAGASTR